MCAVEYGRCYGSSDQAYDDEYGAADTSFILRVAVWIQNLIEKRGKGVEKSAVD